MAALDAEQGSYMPLPFGETTYIVGNKNISGLKEEIDVLHAVGTWGYIFQIMFQVDSPRNW